MFTTTRISVFLVFLVLLAIATYFNSSVCNAASFPEQFARALSNKVETPVGNAGVGRQDSDNPKVVIAEERMSADKMESICLVQAAAAKTATAVITAVITAIIIATTEVAQASATILVQTVWGFRGEIR